MVICRLIQEGLPRTRDPYGYDYYNGGSEAHERYRGVSDAYAQLDSWVREGTGGMKALDGLVQATASRLEQLNVWREQEQARKERKRELDEHIQANGLRHLQLRHCPAYEAYTHSIEPPEGGLPGVVAALEQQVEASRVRAADCNPQIMQRLAALQERQVVGEWWLERWLPPSAGWQPCLQVQLLFLHICRPSPQRPCPLLDDSFPPWAEVSPHFTCKPAAPDSVCRLAAEKMLQPNLEANTSVLSYVLSGTQMLESVIAALKQHATGYYGYSVMT